MWRRGQNCDGLPPRAPTANDLLPQAGGCAITALALALFAGHRLVIGGNTYELSLLPSGVVRNIVSPK
jgi:hypothetical protein